MATGWSWKIEMNQEEVDRTLDLIRNAAVDWLGAAFVLVFIVCGLVLALFSLGALTGGRHGWKAPDYCSLFWMFLGGVVFLLLGMGFLDLFFLQNLEKGRLIVASLVNLTYSAALMLLAVSLMIFEAKRWIQRKIHRRGVK